MANYIDQSYVFYVLDYYNEMTRLNKKDAISECKRKLSDKSAIADVAPVVRSKWMKCIVNGKEKAICAYCGQPNKLYTPPYCPHCGAKMTGEVRTNE